MPTYTDQQIIDRMGDSSDARRRTWADSTFAKAQQGDPQAIQDLQNQAAMGAPGAGAATEDARNYDKMLLGRLSGGAYTPQYGQAHDGGGFFSGLGHTLGSIFKVAAPIAGALIPGVGTLGALAIGSGGSALGGALHGDQFNLGKTLLAGGAAAGGNRLLGNGLGGGTTNWGFGSTPRISPAPTDQMAGAGAPGAPGSAPGGVAGAASAGAGALSRFGGIGSALQKFGPLALGAFGAINQANQQGQARDLRNQGVAAAERDWQSRAPLRDAASQRLLGPVPGRTPSPGLTDPNDPYARARQTNTGGGY